MVCSTRALSTRRSPSAPVGAADTLSSSRFKAERASPLAYIAIVCSALSSTATEVRPSPRSLSSSARQRRLARARGTPEDDRLQQIALDGFAQRPAACEKVALADEFVERARTHPLGQRGGGGVIRQRSFVGEQKHRVAFSVSRFPFYVSTSCVAAEPRTPREPP